MARKSKKGGVSRKPPRPAGCAAPPPTNADWEDAAVAFRKEAESAIRARSHDDGCAAAAAAARLAERHPASPLAHHILGYARASIALTGDAALPVGLVDKVINFARRRSKKPLPYCIPSCVTSLDSMEIQRLDKPLDQLYNHLSRGWEFVRILGDEGKNEGGRSDIISLVQDGSLLSLDAENVASSRKKDGSCEEDALFRWLLNSLEEVAMPWASLRQKCVHHGNEVLEKIYGISDLLLRQFDMKCAAKKKNHRGYSLTEVLTLHVNGVRLQVQGNIRQVKSIQFMQLPNLKLVDKSTVQVEFDKKDDKGFVKEALERLYG
ncbi:unnamed protein product [Miscanthus lutarioriparius]|uniref:Uncharacterized protein n=1 Tax=Miscanthus lutarioriparius TaxID=422564 RepID=A0A811QCE0_9POAL|nr:unnamed protein product [Miscanthus lutarioriparius]